MALPHRFTGLIARVPAPKGWEKPVAPGARARLEAVADLGAERALREGAITSPAGATSGALPDPLRSSFESRLGFDFGRIRIHADAEAGRIADSFAANAVTLGRDIYFAQGRYQPADVEGQRLLAHELVHTVQQGEAPARGMSVDGALRSAAGSARSEGAAATPMCKLRLTGLPAVQARALAIINGGLSPLYTAQINATGDVTLQATNLQGPPTAETQAFTERLKPIIDEAGLTTVSVTASGVPLVGSYVLEQIDVADMERLGSGQRGWTAAASFLHEIVEQRQKQQLGAGSAGGQFGTPTSGAHGTATAAELAVIGAVMESDTSAMTPNPDGTVSGTRTTVFRYPDRTRWQMVVTVVSNNITNVARTQLP
ncbi:hypothetical protein predicted by Glimmer/Critica [Sorangium cellulosum So ce56]|uniref:eCIS core domain-containing protein n=1 Tax=Sorangium cellulosum (strain So ce56) TaxID=448385 RepID=A9FVD6_SORC5|nr:DUF4157 domain-containing protein [Sorangium cellulosum]CAN92264.1 hypothetical protein predicted by Glimmer/Critica [Sorangium cellulosum So ce56]